MSVFFDIDNVRKEKVSLLVFHCFALPATKMLDVFYETNTGVHYIIMRNGTVLNLINEKIVARHAGISSWREFKENINAKSIGIELQNSLLGNKTYTKAQIESLINLSQKIIKRHKIKPQNIVGHSDIAPFRKPDPGKFFPWEELAQAGVGIWPEQTIQKENNHQLTPSEIEKLLQEIGYNTTDLVAALYAFVTRFMPQKIAVRKDIIKTEAEVFAYWRSVDSADINAHITDAPKIYPKDAEALQNDGELGARLKEIAKLYNKKRSNTHQLKNGADCS